VSDVEEATDEGLRPLEDGASEASDSGEVQPDTLNIEAASLGFKLFYKERVERAVIASQRFTLFGGPLFASNIGKIGIARNGSDFEVVPGPTDNNQIGITVWTTYNAWRIFRTKTLELALLRLLNGLIFFEQITGHPGVTSRMVYPGWTMTIDGLSNSVSYLRRSSPLTPPAFVDPALENEVIRALFRDVRITYRLEPDDFLFNYMPAVEPGPYAVTYSFSALPVFLRSSDCCCSLMRTPEPYLWAGAFWGNHNSRDNFPDLAFGFITAMRIVEEGLVPPEVMDAARKAVEASKRIGDLIVANSAIMTVDEHHTYDVLVPSGSVRPDGETENEDLGTLADCQMAFLAHAISSKGLSYPPEPVKAPGSIEYLLVDTLGDLVECQKPDYPRICTSLHEAFCGRTWADMDQMKINGTPWLDLVRQIEESSPGSAEKLIGSFQDDFYEITLAVMALVEYADTVHDEALGADAREVLKELVALMREFADIIYKKTKPAQYKERLYRAALFEAWAGLKDARIEDLGNLEPEEAQIARFEGLLSMPDTSTAPLMTQQQIDDAVRNELSGASASVQKRYKDAYGEEVPIRVSSNGYEARGYPEQDYPWRQVETPHHLVTGGLELLYAIGLCERMKDVVDCSWARLGCSYADVNKDGKVDEIDSALFSTARTAFSSVPCNASNYNCGQADLDRNGWVDDMDEAFLNASKGCYYESR
jgi:hypothetical protein